MQLGCTVRYCTVKRTVDDLMLYAKFNSTVPSVLQYYILYRTGCALQKSLIMQTRILRAYRNDHRPNLDVDRIGDNCYCCDFGCCCVLSLLFLASLFLLVVAFLFVVFLVVLSLFFLARICRDRFLELKLQILT